MKKIVASMIAATLFGAAAVSMCACGGSDNKPLRVIAPDGAPALSLINAVSHEENKSEKRYDFEFVDANNIASYVTGETPEADVCVLPVNAAAKLLGKGDVYQMIGTVTNGNLYFLTTGNAAHLTASAESVSGALLGKKVGVVRLTDVPGLTLQVVLKDYGVPYQILESVEAEAASDKVNLIAFTPDNVTPAGGCDYYLCPEPAASAKVKGTAQSANPFVLAGNLQELYGSESGYPQAVAVVKKSVIESRRSDVSLLTEYWKGSSAYLAETEVITILRHLMETRTPGLAASFNEKNLTKEVIQNCSVAFHYTKDNRDEVTSFLEKLMAVNANATAMPQDEFFYLG